MNNVLSSLVCIVYPISGSKKIFIGSYRDPVECL